MSGDALLPVILSVFFCSVLEMFGNLKKHRRSVGEEIKLREYDPQVFGFTRFLKFLDKPKESVTHYIKRHKVASTLSLLDVSHRARLELPARTAI
jgi:hypothetical protein